MIKIIRHYLDQMFPYPCINWPNSSACIASTSPISALLHLSSYHLPKILSISMLSWIELPLELTPIASLLIIPWGTCSSRLGYSSSPPKPLQLEPRQLWGRLTSLEGGGGELRKHQPLGPRFLLWAFVKYTGFIVVVVAFVKPLQNKTAVLTMSCCP